MDRIGEQSEQSEHLEPATLAITRRTHLYRGVRFVRHGLIGGNRAGRMPAIQWEEGATIERQNNF